MKRINRPAIVFAVHMSSLEILGLVAGMCTSASVIPQLVKSIRLHKAGEVSFFMFLVTMTGNALWLYYGYRKSDVAIMSTNALSVSLNVAMLILKFRYDGARAMK